MVRDKNGFETLLDRIKYYNDSLYSLLPKEETLTISRDVLASLIDSATAEQLSRLASSTTSVIRDNVFESRLSHHHQAISEVANLALQVRDKNISGEQSLWIDEQNITYDDDLLNDRSLN